MNWLARQSVSLDFNKRCLYEKGETLYSPIMSDLHIVDDSDFPSYTSVKDLCPVRFSEDPQLFCRPLTGSSDMSLCSTIRGSSILSSNIAPTPPLRLPFQVTELLTFSLYSLDLGELRPTELFKFVKSDYQRARGVCGFFCGWACALLASWLRNGWTRQVCILNRLS